MFQISGITLNIQSHRLEDELHCYDATDDTGANFTVAFFSGPEQAQLGFKAACSLDSTQRFYTSPTGDECALVKPRLLPSPDDYFEAVPIPVAIFDYSKLMQYLREDLRWTQERLDEHLDSIIDWQDLFRHVRIVKQNAVSRQLADQLQSNWHEQMVMDFKRIIRSMFSGEKSLNYNVTLPGKKSDKTVLQVYWQARSDDTQYRHVLLVKYDITNIVDLMSNTIHSVRNAAQGMQGHLDLLLTLVDLTHESIDLHSEGLRKAIERQAYLANSSLRYIRATTQQIQLVSSVFDLNSAIQPLITAAPPSAHIIYSCGGKSPMKKVYVKMDEGLLTQVVENLLDNATRHTPANGTISVNIKVNSKHQKLALHVSNTVNKIVDVTLLQQRLSASNPLVHTQQSTSGFGLPAIAKLIDLTNGRITVLSDSDKIIFKVELPYLTPNEAEIQDYERTSLRKERSGPLEEILDHKPRVLFIEDNEVNRATTTKMLEILGCNVVAYSSANPAIQNFRKTLSENQPFDLVISDAGLPGKNGITAIKEMRAIEGSERKATSVIPMYILSGSAVSDHELTGSLIKPFGLRDLQALLKIQGLYSEELSTYQAERSDERRLSLIFERPPSRANSTTPSPPRPTAIRPPAVAVVKPQLRSLREPYFHV